MPQQKTFFYIWHLCKVLFIYFFLQLLEDYKKEVESQKVFYFLLDMGKREWKWQKSQENKLSPSNRLSSFVHLLCFIKINGGSNELKKWSSHLLGSFSDCLVCAPEKFQVSSRVFEPMTSVMLVQGSNEWSYEATQMWAGQFVGLMCSRERND